MITWDECRWAFEPDGRLRVIHVRVANAVVWEAALRFLLAQGVSTYLVDGHEAPGPRQPHDALRLRPGASPALLGRRNGIEFACHFFSEDDVEINFLPSDIDGPERFESLLSFVRGLGRATVQDVLITPEDCADVAFLRYDFVSDGFARVSAMNERTSWGGP